MSPRLVPAGSDPVGRRDRPLTITVDGEPLAGVAGQSLAGVLLAVSRTSAAEPVRRAARSVLRDRCLLRLCGDGQR